MNTCGHLLKIHMQNFTEHRVKCNMSRAQSSASCPNSTALQQLKTSLQQRNPIVANLFRLSKQNFRRMSRKKVLRKERAKKVNQTEGTTINTTLPIKLKMKVGLVCLKVPSY